ncbi:MBG domain-containing protein [Fibrobacter sp.]|uniref:MBG domain-containing protein n=1 Tax=Fibrobacter sp. TaxID=35828 RepID=UPI00388FEBA0
MEGESESLIARTVARATGENVGTYAITASGEATQGNYSVTYEPATFTVTKAAVTIAAENKEQVFGAEAVALTATVTGKPESGVAVNYTLARAEGDDVGTYAIGVTLGENPNYEITTTSGTYTITPKAIAVAVNGNNASTIYDGADHTITGFTATTEETLYDVSNVALATGKTAFSSGSKRAPIR